MTNWFFIRVQINISFPFAFLSFIRNSAIKDGEVTPFRQKKKIISLFCSQLFRNIGFAQVTYIRK